MIDRRLAVIAVLSLLIVLPVAAAGQSPLPAASLSPASTAASPVELLWSATGGSDGLDFPGSMALDPGGRLWVADTGNDRFAIFTADGEFLEYWGSSGTGEGQFRLQRSNGDGYGAIAFAPDESFYVLDAGNRRVQHFDPDRTFIGAWGGFGTGQSQYNNPIGLAVDAQGVVYVLDDVRDVVETYDADGHVLGSFAPHLAGFNSANGLTLDPEGDIYVSSCCASGNQVEKFDASGTAIATIGSPGTGPGLFVDQPLGMAIDSAGRLFVGQGPDKGLDVQVFDADGQYLTRWGGAEAGEVENTFPWGVLLDGQGNVYVSEASYPSTEGAADRIEKFRLLPPFTSDAP